MATDDIVREACEALDANGYQSMGDELETLLEVKNAEIKRLRLSLGEIADMDWDPRANKAQQARRLAQAALGWGTSSCG